MGRSGAGGDAGRRRGGRRRRLAPDAESRPVEDQRGARTRDDGTEVVESNGDGRARLELAGDAGGRVLVDVQADDGYAFLSPRWSPDGARVLVVDTAGRLLVVDASTGTVGVLAEDVSSLPAPAVGP